MTEAKQSFTQGPWQTATNFHQNCVADADGIAIGYALGTDKEARANARLIAAAPDLLAALTTFVAQYVELVESGDAGVWDAEKDAKVIAARAAIKKAVGQ